MRQTQDQELTARINAFLDKKRAQFPELDNQSETKAPKARGVIVSQITALLKPFHVT
jgi:hypothetical protein